MPCPHAILSAEAPIAGASRGGHAVTDRASRLAPRAGSQDGRLRRLRHAHFLPDRRGRGAPPLSALGGSLRYRSYGPGRASRPRGRRVPFRARERPRAGHAGRRGALRPSPRRERLRPRRSFRIPASRKVVDRRQRLQPPDRYRLDALPRARRSDPRGSLRRYLYDRRSRAASRRAARRRLRSGGLRPPALHRPRDEDRRDRAALRTDGLHRGRRRRALLPRRSARSSCGTSSSRRARREASKRRPSGWPLATPSASRRACPSMATR